MTPAFLAELITARAMAESSGLPLVSCLVSLGCDRELVLRAVARHHGGSPLPRRWLEAGGLRALASSVPPPRADALWVLTLEGRRALLFAPAPEPPRLPPDADMPHYVALQEEVDRIRSEQPVADPVETAEFEVRTTPTRAPPQPARAGDQALEDTEESTRENLGDDTAAFDDFADPTVAMTGVEEEMRARQTAEPRSADDDACSDFDAPTEALPLAELSRMHTATLPAMSTERSKTRTGFRREVPSRAPQSSLIADASAEEGQAAKGTQDAFEEATVRYAAEGADRSSDLLEAPAQIDPPCTEQQTAEPPTEEWRTLAEHYAPAAGDTSQPPVRGAIGPKPHAAPTPPATQEQVTLPIPPLPAPNATPGPPALDTAITALPKGTPIEDAPPPVLGGPEPVSLSFLLDPPALEAPIWMPNAVSSPPPSPEAASSSQLGGYRLGEVLGQGGMATVFRATTPTNPTPVALKVLSSQLVANDAFVERFKREIRATSPLDHPNITRVLDHGEENGRHFFVSELMDKGTLRDLLHQAGPLPILLTVRLLEHLLQGLAHAHAHGTIHRDLKPGNLMLSSSGHLKIGDFGIAKSHSDNTITQTGALFGTPAYMSPEQALGETLDLRSDLFSVGIIAHEMLTGTNPYYTESPSASLLKVSRATAALPFAERPAIPPLLTEALFRLSARKREERFASAQDALDFLRPLIQLIDDNAPDLLARFLETPAAMLQALRREEADTYFRQAKRCIAAQHPEPGAAALAAYAAVSSDPRHEQAAALLAELVEAHAIRFSANPNERITETLAELATKPETPGLVKRLTDLYRAAGNPHLGAAYLRRYLQLRPQDSHARLQLEQLVGADPLGAFAPGAADDEEDIWNPPTGLDWSALPRPGEIKSTLPRDAAAAFEGGGLPAPANTPESTDVPAAFRQPPAGAPARVSAARPRRGLSLAAVGLGLLATALIVTDGLSTLRARFAAASFDPGAGRTLDQRQQALLARAEELWNAHQSVDAQAHLDVVISLAPESPFAVRARLLRAKLWRERGEEERAREDLQSILSTTPPDNLFHLEAQQLLLP